MRSRRHEFLLTLVKVSILALGIYAFYLVMSWHRDIYRQCQREGQTIVSCQFDKSMKTGL